MLGHRAARRDEREPGVVDLVDEVHEQQGRPLVVERGEIRGRRPRRAPRARPRPARAARLASGRQGRRSSSSLTVAPPATSVCTIVSSSFAAERIGLDARLRSVVGPVDADDLEVRRDRRDLASEVVGRETSLAEAVGQRVRRGDDLHARSDHRSEEGHGHQRLRDVVELELVDAEQPVRREGGDRRLHAEEPDDAGELGEREVRLRRRRLVPRGGEQVGLADAVAAVEVARGGAGWRVRFPQRFGLGASPIAEVKRSIAARRGRLRRMGGVGQVGREPRRGEASRRHEARQQIRSGQMGTAVDEPNDPAHLARAHSHSIVPGGFDVMS